MRVGGVYVREIVCFLERFGASRSAVRRIADGDLGALDHPLARFDHRLVMRLLERWSVETGRRRLGVEFGCAGNGASAGLIGVIAATADTLGDALDVIPGLMHLHGTHGRMRVRRLGRTVHLVWEELDRGPGWSPHLAESLLASWTGFLRRFMGDNVSPLGISFAHASGPSVSEYEAALRCPVNFGSDVNVLVLPADALDSKPPRAMPELHRRLLGVARMGRMAQETEAMMADPVLWEALVAKLGGGGPLIGDVASDLRLGKRTLQRRLQARGITYRDALAYVRANAAINDLLRHERSVSEIGGFVQFAEHSAFTRAFGRWTGLSPRAFREAFPPGYSGFEPGKPGSADADRHRVSPIADLVVVEG